MVTKLFFDIKMIKHILKNSFGDNLVCYIWKQYTPHRIGCILWPEKLLENEFCCLPSGTTLKLHQSIDWLLYALYEFTTRKPAVSLYFTIKHHHFLLKLALFFFFKLHVIHSYCTSSKAWERGGGITRFISIWNCKDYLSRILQILNLYYNFGDYCLAQFFYQQRTRSTRYSIDLQDPDVFYLTQIDLASSAGLSMGFSLRMGFERTTRFLGWDAWGGG
jgi:hypothetical protein